MSDIAQSPRSLGSSISEVRSKWGWFVALGIAFLVLGAIAFCNVVTATVVSVFYVGMLMLIGAVMEIIHAFGVKSWGSFFWWLLSGMLYAIAGVIAFVNPLLAARRAHALIGRRPGRRRHFADLGRLRARPTANWGWIVAGRRHHAACRPDHRDRLAGQQPVDSRPVPGDRPDLPGLDVHRLRAGVEG